nr:immunoglobulin light chain junction region [Macaca mulatta]
DYNCMIEHGRALF